MKNDWEFELKALQSAQEDLHRRLETLDQRMAQLRMRMSAEEAAEAMEAAAAIVDPPTTLGRAVSPTLPTFPDEPVEVAPAVSLSLETATPKPKCIPPPLPQFDLPSLNAAPLEPPLPPPPKAEASPKPPEPPEPAEGLEMKVGKYWLVRIGILVLLTGLVLLANLAYQSFITQFGAAGKLSLMFLASCALLGVGCWLERRVEKVRNYARVLMAGGAAAIYYTVYAAHFVASLRVIESPILAGALLLGLAGAFAWFAERRRSQGIAFATILLSYYTSAINSAAEFTLFSNVLLTALAAFLLIRHRWFNVTWLALIGSYASFAYWRLQTFNAGGDLWTTHGFLAAYWIIFTLAIFLNRASAFPVAHRGFFLTANNGAFFALAAPTVARWFPGEFWAFCIGYGLILLGLAALAWKFKREEPGFDGTYLAQGLLVLTLGFVTKFTGYDLALVLMVESAALLFLSRFRHAWLFQIFAALAAIAAFILTLFHNAELPNLIIAGLLLFNAWHLKLIRKTLTEFRFDWGAAVYALPALILGGIVLTNRFDGSELIWTFASAAVVLTVMGYLLRVPEVAVFAQGYLGVALLELVVAPVAWTTTLPFLILGSALMHAWQWRRRNNPIVGRFFEALDALAVGVALYLWLFSAHANAENQMLNGVLAGLAMLLYGMVTRAWFLAALGQVFTITGLVSYLDILLNDPRTSWYLTLGAWALVAAQAGGLRWLPGGSTGSIKLVQTGYRGVVALLGLVWMAETFPKPMQFFLLTLVALLMFVPAALQKNREYLVYAGSIAVFGFLTYFVRISDGFSGYNLLALTLLLVIQQVGRSLLASTAFFPRALQAILAVVAIIGIWVESSRWSQDSPIGIALTLVWAVLALIFLAAGFLLRERAYRLMGLVILTVAVGHVFFVDVWGMGQLARILGMFGLAGILMLIGYIYNRFSDQIKKWL